MVKITTNVMNFLKNLFYTKNEVDTKLNGKSNTSHSHSDDDVSVTTANYGEGINQNTFNGYLSYDMLTVKEKLNGIDEGANKITIDSSLSSSSTNPVQNKVIQTALDEKANTEHTHNDYEGINTLSKEWINLDCTTQFHINRKLWQIYDKVITMDDYANNYKLPTASADILGGVKVGTNLSIDDNGILSATDTTYGTATTSANGLMSSSDKTKLNGIATNANNYSLPTASSSTLGGVKVGDSLNINSGRLSVDKVDDIEYGVSKPITSSGVYDAINSSQGEIYVAITNAIANIDIATTSINGLMSSSDKSKLDGIATGANKITVDSSLSSSSTNPVQNKVINTALSGKASTSVATTSANGLMSSSDKTKLNGIATGATKVTVDSSLSSSSTNPVQNKVINSALAGKAASSHTHNDYVNKGTITVAAGQGTVRVFKKNGWVLVFWEGLGAGSNNVSTWFGQITLPYSNQAGQKIYADFDPAATRTRVRINENAQLQTYIASAISGSDTCYGHLIYPTAD